MKINKLVESKNQEFLWDNLDNGKYRVVDKVHNVEADVVKDWKHKGRYELVKVDGKRFGGNANSNLTKSDVQNKIIDFVEESKKLKEGITNTEPVVKFQGKSSHTFTKDKKWEVDFDEAGNILARTRYGKPYYFKGHINDKVSDFPSTDEDNIILAARKQYRLKFDKIDEAMDGFVRTYCDSCGKPNRVKVHFPSYNKGFDTTTYKCKYCNTKNELTDPHEYNDDGTLKEDTAVSSGYEKLKFGKKTDSFEKDGGPFWYFSKHGLGPGMLPKGVNVVDTLEDDNFGTYVALDKVLSTQELKDYELKERTPEEKDLFRVDESKQLNETKYGKDELWNQINNNEWAYNTLSNKVKTAVEKGLPKERIVHIVRKAIFSMKDDFGRIPTTQAERLELARDFVEDELQGYSFEDDDMSVPSYRRTGTWSRLGEAFKPSDSGIQSVKCYNQYNYTIQELRVDNDNKTFERGQFTMGKPDKKTKNRQEFEDIVDTLKELGYTEIKSDYRSMRNKSRKGKPTNESKESEESELITQYINNGEFDKLEKVKNGTNVVWKLKKSISESDGKTIEEPTFYNLPYGWEPADELGNRFKYSNSSNIIYVSLHNSIADTNHINIIIFIIDRNNPDNAKEIKYTQYVDDPSREWHTVAVNAMLRAKDELRKNTTNESLDDGIEIETIGDYIVDHYEFDDIDDKYSCINSIRDSFKGQKTISKEELEQFIGAHNGKDKMNEAHYGGAFDIADDQYFTREDIEDAAEEVLNHINETFIDKFSLTGTWFEEGNWIVSVSDDPFNEWEESIHIDMRKIKSPSHLKKAYALDMAAKLIAKIKEDKAYDLDEDTSVSSGFEYDDDVDDLTYYYDDEEFKRMLDEEPYNEIASKRVPDSDGFLTDYTMYRNMNDGTYVFIFGDKDIYTPGNSDFDWECDTEEEAKEWFDNYVGFDDDLLDECWSSILEDAETETSPIVHKKSDGSYLVQSDNGDGYTAFNKDNVCQGHISASNETEAKNKFNSNKFDE